MTVRDSEAVQAKVQTTAGQGVQGASGAAPSVLGAQDSEHLASTDGVLGPNPRTGFYEGRFTARPERDEFVVFLIGMRINQLWKVHKWVPVARAMGRMISELQKAPEMGFIHAENWFGRTTLMVQYWESFEKLEAYAVGKEQAHVPAWKDFNRAIGWNGDVGIWHETYVVRRGDYECVYGNMPAFGLGKAMGLMPAQGAYARAPSRKEAAREAA